jgi:DNA-binding PadR family transcriptional regulator
MKAMQEPTFMILTALADSPQHGYGIIADVQRISDGRLQLRAGTLYAALDRLGADGLVAADHEEIVDGRLRRYYRLTDDGAAALATEVDRLRQRTEIAARRLAGRPQQLGWSS